MNKNSSIYVAGHRGLVGSAIYELLKSKGYTNIITRTREELDLINQVAVEDFFEKNSPEYVFLAAAYVGGIHANSAYPADFIYRNTMIGANVVHAAYQHGTKKLMNLGSTCIYPKLAPQPLKEESLLSGYLEPTNDAYALAKINTLKMCTSFNKQYGTDFLSVMPTNLYGKNDNYDLSNSHVLAALIRKFHEAKSSGANKVTLWGDGTPYREFLYVDDLADAVVYLMENCDAKDLRNDAGDFVNIGTGKELTIKHLAELIRTIVYSDKLVQGKAEADDSDCHIAWDTAMPNGTPRKISDVSRLTRLGWKAKTGLKEGIQLTYRTFLEKNEGKS